MPLRKPPPGDEQLEIFSAVFTDIVSKDARETMELPFLSLSKRPRFKPIHYVSPRGMEVTVSGGEPYGIANIFDWDLIIWLLSQLRQAANCGQEISRKIRFSRWSYLKDARRHTSGDEYRRFEGAIKRLKNTTVTTTIRAQHRRTVMFSWIEYAEIERDDKGNPRDITVVLPEWLFDSVCNKKLMLTIHRDYFLLTGGIERWLYRTIRKGAGKQPGGWQWKLSLLHEKSGTTQKYKYFARELRKIIKRGTLVDYQLKLENGRCGQMLFARHVSASKSATPAAQLTKQSLHFLRLSTETYEKAKRVAPGHDIYGLEQQWLEYNWDKGTVIRQPDAAFIAFCVAHARRNSGYTR